MNKSVTSALSEAADINSVIALVSSLERKETRLGRSSYVVTSKGAEVKTAFKVVDASSLIISNNLDGMINPAFPEELQPRDRTRLSSKLQVNRIASNLRPAQLTDSGMSSHGAPIVGPDNVVESGNGRSMGIWRAYEQGQADEYRQYVTAPRPVGRGFPLLRLLPSVRRIYAGLHGQKRRVPPPLVPVFLFAGY